MPNSTVIGRALAGCVALAALSLLLSAEPLFDPWAWLVWGRELVDLDLDTSAGPSWKPLPSLVAAPLSLLGDAAPDLWLLLARAAWLAVPVMVWRLAARLEGSGGRRAAAAGALAAVGALLIADDVTAWSRQGAGGLSEPLVAALALGAIDAALARRPRPALAFAFLACLLRPEAWPFALFYAWREARAGRVGAPAVATGALLVPLLWFLPDLLAAGDALEGADRARGADNSPLEVLGWAVTMPATVLWVGAAALVYAARRERLGSPALVLAAGAGAWILLVAAMASVGYAGLPRFMAPAVAVVCALGAAGLVRAFARGWLPAPVVALLAVALAADLGVRAADVPGQLERAGDDAALSRDLRDLADESPAAFTGCPPLWTSDFVTQAPLAWQLELPMGEIVTTASVAPADGTLVVGPRSDAGLAARMLREARAVASSADWDVYATGSCASEADPGSG